MRLGLIVLLIGCFTGTCFARSLKWPDSWSKPTADGRAVFVMRAPEDGRRSKGNETLAFEAKYAKSGLYPVGGSVPYWTVDWFAWERNVVLSDSGEYLAVAAPWNQKPSFCLGFFARGKLIKAWQANEVDPEQVRRVNAQNGDHGRERYYGYWREFGLSLYRAKASKDGRLELETQSRTVVFSITTGEMLRKPQPPAPYKCPEDPVAYEAFCRALGTTGTRNPNFISGLPEPEFELVPIPRPPRRAGPRAVVAPFTPYSNVSPPLAADPTDWRWYIVAGTALSYALCFCGIRMRSRKSPLSQTRNLALRA